MADYNRHQTRSHLELSPQMDHHLGNPSYAEHWWHSVSMSLEQEGLLQLYRSLTNPENDFTLTTPAEVLGYLKSLIEVISKSAGHRLHNQIVVTPEFIANVLKLTQTLREYTGEGGEYLTEEDLIAIDQLTTDTLNLAIEIGVEVAEALPLLVEA